MSEGLYLTPFSSRGELRSQVLALKILELEYLTQNDDRPVLLLDDVLSELDEDRRIYLLKFLYTRFQTFITSTVPIEMDAQHINLKQGLFQTAQPKTKHNTDDFGDSAAE
jgi:recombinational DNA repair ATPase RecF